MDARLIGSAAAAIALTFVFAAPAQAKPCRTNIHVNGSCVSTAKVRKLERAYGTESRAGRYWYDRRSGLMGVEGQPPFTQIAAGLDLGGRLKRNASNGTTRVFINGRELHATEVAFLRRFGPVVPGRYWMNARLDVGFEGNAMPFANLGAAMQRGRRGGGSSYYSNSNLGTYAGSSGGCSYVSTTSGSVMTGNCN